MNGKWFFAAVLAMSLALAGGVCGQAEGVDPASVTTVQSRSGQFVVSGWAKGRLPQGNQPTQAEKTIRLTPELLTVTCERIKGAFLTLLDGSDHWRGKIHLYIRPNLSPGNGATVTPVLGKTGYTYNVDLPEWIEPEKLVRAVVTALVQEAANRSARDRAAEVPLWLVEGITRELLVEKGRALMVEAPDAVRVAGNVWMVGASFTDDVRRDPLLPARNYLRGKPMLTFTELCLPTKAQLSGEGWILFQNSAQVLCMSLMQLKSGRDQMREMISLLPQHLNWQTAFLIAYAPHFGRLLDVEKWWAVTLASFTGRNEKMQMTRLASLSKLDEILVTPVNIRLTRESVPARSVLRLQQVIQEWDITRQRLALEAKVQAMTSLLMESPPEVAVVIEKYRDALAEYLKQRSPGSSNPQGLYPMRGQPAESGVVAMKNASRKLSEIDLELAKLKEKAAQEPVATSLK